MLVKACFIPSSVSAGIQNTAQAQRAFDTHKPVRSEFCLPHPGRILPTKKAHGHLKKAAGNYQSVEELFASQKNGYSLLLANDGKIPPVHLVLSLSVITLFKTSQDR
jgi:hypothetical protein